MSCVGKEEVRRGSKRKSTVRVLNIENVSD